MVCVYLRLTDEQYEQLMRDEKARQMLASSQRLSPGVSYYITADGEIR